MAFCKDTSKVKIQHLIPPLLVTPWAGLALQDDWKNQLQPFPFPHVRSMSKQRKGSLQNLKTGNIATKYNRRWPISFKQGIETIEQI
jgi:hypothetical protein